MPDFDWNPLTFDHALFLPKNKQNIAKSNPIFHLKGRRDTALILRFSDSPISELFPENYFEFSILVSFMG